MRGESERVPLVCFVQRLIVQNDLLLIALHQIDKTLESHGLFVNGHCDNTHNTYFHLLTLKHEIPGTVEQLT